MSKPTRKVLALNKRVKVINLAKAGKNGRQIVDEIGVVSSWIPDVGDGSVLKEPVRNVANDADLDRVRVVARNTIERVARAANHGFEKRVLNIIILLRIIGGVIT
ncbi:hypothetical protein LOTGIDRAFT_157189 [Lottia gigantea]|uniref:Uncharacterized protein n=1 Tax=Lottia gigantea TaxID=225164 RepID=V4AWZ1_LOTGI|nr:hypothetical protein LOTGIDRAFT_157189 [Lottia gigantea]ESP02048.1 hypothetical protein LOTGIDRAFT_157189 [Lottia gigantea]